MFLSIIAFGSFGLVRVTLWLWFDWARFGPNLACFGLGSARVGLVFVASWSGWARLWLALKRLYKHPDALKKDNQLLTLVLGSSLYRVMCFNINIQLITF
jgi:hypothetical protein